MTTNTPATTDTENRPSAKGPDKGDSAHSQAQSAELVQVDKALESWRDAGFDLTAAAGEAVDNSIEASATTARIQTYPKSDKPKSIDAIAFSDDGVGIDPHVLPHVLSLGFSTRYGQRNGLGRFGVGLKLAALSHARRIDLYTRQLNEDVVRHSWLDLDDVQDHTQTHIVSEELDNFPEEYAELLRGDEGASYESGTLVVWSKVDRLQSGGRFRTDLGQQLKELQTFLARTYRKFLDKGLRIDLNGREITLHDPTFQLQNPRVIDKLGKDIRGEVVAHESIDVDGENVNVTVTVVPEDLIPPKGRGGSSVPRDLHIPENERRISFLRQGREINYDLVHKMLPGSGEWGDRYIGVEVNFPAALDEYFQVRNVKRGVVPVDKLRQQLRTTLKRPYEAARKRYRARWDQLDNEERNITEDHGSASGAVSTVEQTAPRGKAGAGLTEEEQKERVEEVLTQVQSTPEANNELADKLRDAVERLPITVVDSTWPGKELLDITHLNGKAIVKMNHGHPFVREVYDSARTMASRTADEVDPAEAVRFARRVETGIDLLLMAYAKAENMHREPDQAFSDLRSYWGQSAAAYVTEAFKDR